MNTLKPEQLEKFLQYEQAHAGEPIKPEGLRGVVDDDIRESEKTAAKRLKHSREYNHAPGAVEPRQVAEKDL